MAAVITSALFLFALMSSLQEPRNILANAQSENFTILNPETLTDSNGNSADQFSNITYADVKDSQTYKSKEKPEDGFESLSPLYGLTESLVNSALPGGFPFEWVSKIKENKIDIESDWKKAAVDYLGYTVALAVGIVFFLVFPTVGMIFCCCRCCGRCGGRRVIKSATEAGHGDKCGRLTSLSLLSAFTAMALTGSILMFVTNTNLSTSFNDLLNKDIDKLDDIPLFLNSTVQQAEQMVNANFNFTLEVLFRDLDNIGFLLGIPVRDRLLQDTGLGQSYKQIDALDADAREINQHLETLNKSRAVVEDKARLFKDFTVTMTKTLEDMALNNSGFGNYVSNRTIITQFDASQLPDETVNHTILSTFLQHGNSSLTAESRKNLNKIPEMVHNGTLDQRRDLKSSVHSYEDEIKEIIDNLKSMRDDVMQDVNIDKMTNDAKNVTDKVIEYEKYRWYGGLGLAGLMMIIVLLLTLGILLGFFGGNPAHDPSERSGVSNAGGNLLVAGVMLTFQFVWLTMLLTTLLFAIGAPVDKFACGAVRDLSVFDKLLDDYNLFGDAGENKSWLGSKIYAGKDVSLKLSELVESCKNGEAAYTALKMEQAKVLNLSEVTNYKKKFNVDGKIDGNAITFDNINITAGPMMQFIDFMRDFSIDYPAYQAVLQIDPVEPSVLVYKQLIAYKTNQSSSSSITFQVELNRTIAEFETNLNSHGAELMGNISAMQNALKRINKTTQEPTNNTLRERCITLQQLLPNVEHNFSTNAKHAFNESVKDFENRITRILDAFIAALENAVKNKIGVCLPVWNLYNDVVVHGLCHSIVGTLNTWWCTFGWTSFFLTTSISAAVKLSKHFRRMTYSKKSSHSSAKPNKKRHFKNKITHCDLPNGETKF